MRKLLSIMAFLCLSATLYVSCKHELPIPISGGGTGGTTPPTGTGGQTCSPDTVYFNNTILPILTSNCAMAGCHDATSKKEGLILNNYTGIMKIVKPGNAAGSSLVSVIISNDPGKVMPPPPMAKLSTSQIDAIKKWINQGAKNNSCNGCDTASFTYNAVVKVVMTNKCVGCHNAASPGGGIDLSTHAGVKAVALNGKLMGSVNMKAGFVAMPLGGSKLPDCEIKQLQKWVDAGALNN